MFRHFLKWFFFLQSSGNSPDILQWVDVPIVSDEDCGENYSTFDEETMICAGGEVSSNSLIILVAIIS